MQVLLLHLAVLVGSCQGERLSSPGPRGLRISDQDSMFSFEMVEDPRIDALKSRIESSLLQADHQSLSEGLDSLLAILASSSYLFQKGEIAQFLVDLVSGEAAFRYEAKMDDYERISRMMLGALRSPENLCFRTEQLLNLTDGRLLRVSGDETAAIARATHARGLYLGDLIMGENDGGTFRDYLNVNDNSRLIDFYRLNCSG